MAVKPIRKKQEISIEHSKRELIHKFILIKIANSSEKDALWFIFLFHFLFHFSSTSLPLPSLCYRF